MTFPHVLRKPLSAAATGLARQQWVAAKGAVQPAAS
jgi:hypothetical protein